MLLRKFASVALLVAALLPNPALAAIVAQPYAIIPNTLANATQVQADFSTIYSNVNGNLDATNFANGTGLYASNIIPTNTTQATFGGSQTYTFPSSLVVGGNITNSGNVNSGQGFFSNLSNGYTANAITYGTGYSTFGNVQINSSASNSVAGIDGELLGLSSNSQYFLTFDHLGNLAIAGNYYTPGSYNGQSVNVAGNGTFGTYAQAHYFNSDYSATQGLYYGGGSNTSQLDFNITNSNDWTFTSPVVVQGSISQHVSSTNYVTPYDANSTGGSTNTHIEHPSTPISYGSITNGTCVTNQWNFQKAFTTAPAVTANSMFTPSGGDSVSTIVTSITTTYAYIAVCNNSVSARTISVSAFASGE